MAKKINKTTQVVKAAMKAVSKDVRAPKVVRDGIVKKTAPKKKIKKELPIQIFKPVIIPKEEIIDYIQLGKLKFKGDQILTMPEFAETKEYISTMDFAWLPPRAEYLPGPTTYEDVIIDFVFNEKMFLKLFELFKVQSKLDLIVVYKNKTRVVATGALREIHNVDMWLNECMGFVFSPDIFAIY